MTVVYSDEICQVSINDRPITEGHIRITPQAQTKYLDMLPGAHIAHMFNLANVCAQILFEGLKAEGTNIICRNGMDGQVSIEVIARKQNDGLGMLWEPQQGDKNEIQSVAFKIKDAIIPADPQPIVEQEAVEEEVVEQEDEQREKEPWDVSRDYRLDAFKRLP